MFLLIYFGLLAFTQYGTLAASVPESFNIKRVLYHQWVARRQKLAHSFMDRINGTLNSEGFN